MKTSSSAQRNISCVVEQRIEITRRVSEHPREQRRLATMVYRVNRRVVQHLSHRHPIALPRHEAELHEPREVRVIERRQKIALVPFDLVGSATTDCNVG